MKAPETGREKNERKEEWKRMDMTMAAAGEWGKEKWDKWMGEKKITVLPHISSPDSTFFFILDPRNAIPYPSQGKNMFVRRLGYFAIQPYFFFSDSPSSKIKSHSKRSWNTRCTNDVCECREQWVWERQTSGRSDEQNMKETSFIRMREKVQG
jgi:hypothetical protein